MRASSGGPAANTGSKALGGYYAEVGNQEMNWAKADPDYVPPEIDVTKPSVARVYDAILGGKDNFAVDRAVAAEAFKALPDDGKGARYNRAVLGRAVRFMASQGIDQFLDLGSGLPTLQNTHEIAQALNPAARVVYVDNDISVRVHAHALLADDASTIVVMADLREPASILESPEITSFLDFSRPIGLILNAVIHHITDDEDPHGLVARYVSAIAPGSYVQITHFSNASEKARAMEKVLQQALGRKLQGLLAPTEMKRLAIIMARRRRAAQRKALRVARSLYAQSEDEFLQSIHRHWRASRGGA